MGACEIIAIGLSVSDPSLKQTRILDPEKVAAASQWLGKHISTATYTHVIIGRLFNAA
jgi:hypothetical protein